ncbi:MAG: hypothetical protein H7256_14220 [Bdellovibrio sp.]|nr:hypothetical protein [Bdellovibrio sp.]
MTAFSTTRLVITLGLLALLTACGNTKSQSSNAVTSSTSLATTSTLAYCNKSADSNFSFNTSVVTDANGNVSTDYIKMKFNFLNANITKSGNVLKFYKWRVSGSQSVLDSTPLNVATYTFGSGQTNSSLASSIDASQFNGTSGLYIQLNDPSAVYQVVKVVAYDSSGTAIANLNSLIPTFAANPATYSYNSDGSARATILQQMHALYGQTTTDAAAKASFDAYCF